MCFTPDPPPIVVLRSASPTLTYLEAAPSPLSLRGEIPANPQPPPPPTQGVETEEEEDLVITLEGISTSLLAQITGRFYRWLGKKLPLGADVRAIQVQ